MNSRSQIHAMAALPHASKVNAGNNFNKVSVDQKLQAEGILIDRKKWFYFMALDEDIQ